MGVAVDEKLRKRRAAQYSKESETRRRIASEKSAAGQDIGEIPKVKNRRRRNKAIKSYAYFCKTYFPQAFTLPWSEYHLSAANKIEKAVLAGGLFGFAMPRGSGKTTMCEWAVLWASICGHSLYTVLIAASESTAEKQLKNIKTTLSTNDLLYEDFPEVLHGIRHLENSSRRCEGQRHNGERTGIGWQARRVIYPSIWQRGKLTPASGALIEIYGLTGEIRGGRHARMDGSIVRPRIAICDDPQTRESARSATQTQSREATLSGDVCYLAGPGKPIAVIMPCTVIYKYDLADNMLDREKHPEWQGERTSMVESFPDHMDLWDEYADIMHTSLKSDGDKKAATAFYRKHRKKMDAGAKVSWPERFNDDQLSGIQHAMDLKIRDEDTFYAECQNQPAQERSDLLLMSSDEIQEKLHGYRHREVPSACTTVTAFVDVHRSVLYWCVAAWDPNFTGYIIDYGTFPEQHSRYFALSGARNTIQTQYPTYDDEAALFASLGELIPKLATYDWLKEDGTPIRITRMMVDANWGATSELVNSAIRQSPHAAILTPFYGRGIKASNAPISRWPNTIKGRFGPEWVPSKPKTGQAQVTGLIADVNYWKKRFHGALGIPLGSRGSISLFKSRHGHRLFADHLVSERPVKTQSDTRVVYEWNLTPGADNHFFDTAVGTMIAASVTGISPPETQEPLPVRPRRMPPRKRRWKEH